MLGMLQAHAERVQLVSDGGGTGKPLSAKVSVKHKQTAGKKSQTLIEMSVKSVNIPSKYVVFESEFHPFRQVYKFHLGLRSCGVKTVSE